MKFPLKPQRVADVVSALTKAVENLGTVQVHMSQLAADTHAQASKLSAEAREHDVEAARALRIKTKLEELLK
jgi:hypothetical protein